MFKIEDRSDIYKWLIFEIKKIEQVEALIQVGSGASGYKDQYSDIDLVLIVPTEEDVKNVIHYLTRIILLAYPESQFKIYHHHNEVKVGCFFLDNFLELDLGVWTYHILHSTKPNYKVIYSNLPLEEKLQYKEKTIDLEKVYKDHFSKLWQFVNDAAISIKRNQMTKALKAIQVIRDMCQEVVCLQHKITYDYDKVIDEIKPNFITLYEYELSDRALLEHLEYVVTYYFNHVPGYEDEKQMLVRYLKEMQGRL